LQIEISEKSAWSLWAKAVSGNLSAAAPNVQALPISVLVCTRDRPQALARCLRSLNELDYPAYEVVVVDNCSCDAKVAHIIEGAGFRYVREDRPGLDWARNRGIQESRHEIVAFIDDDAIASRGWLRAISRVFVDPEVMAVTGLILPAEIETQSQALFEQYGGMSKGLESRLYRPLTMSARELLVAQNFGAGANMAFRRQLFARVGGFDTALDTGTPSGGCGDLDMFHRVLAGGFTIRYQPDAWILHTHRRDLDGLRRQLYANGRSHGVYLIKRWVKGNIRRRETLVYALYWLLGWVCARFLRGLWHRPFFPRTLLWAELKGAISAPWAYVATYRNRQ
jgi:glycosyltransferase involved in cell wall biosynthesis